MGTSGSKQTASPPLASATTDAQAAGSSSDAVKAPPPRKSDNDQYLEFRDDLLAFSMGEAAHDYAKRLLKDQPDSPPLMALFSETAWMYEKVKNPVRREHWCDRLDVLQEGIDVARKCIKENPDYAPCHRVYTLCAAKMADQAYWFKLAQPFGAIEHYNRIINRGSRAVELHPDADVYSSMAQLSARVATQTKKWWAPYRWYSIYCKNPTRDELYQRARDWHLKVQELQPKNVENACRLAMVYFEMGDLDASRRWYQKARDELICDNPAHDIYQTIAHTHLVTQFNKTSWNIPFG